MKRIFLLAVVLCVVSGFSAKADQFLMNIDRVFMHTPGDYTVAYVDSHKVVVFERLNSPRGELWNWIKGNGHWSGWNGVSISSVVIADVAIDKPMYIIAKAASSENIVGVEIHVHSPKDIDGGEWSTGGKHPQHAQTSVIE